MPNDDIPIRVPLESVGRADSLIPALQEVPELRAWGRVSRAAIIRLALVKGLNVLEAEYGPGGTHE